MSQPASCRWIASDKPRGVVGEHYDQCSDETCRGCWPCLHGHCLICRREHNTTSEPQVCGKCVGTVREDLELVVDMHARLRAEAVNAGTRGDSDDEDRILGGDAMVMLAMPYRDQTGRAAAWRDDWDRSHERDEDPVPPLLTLASWEDVWRDHLGHAQAGSASIAAAATYLGQQLTLMAQVIDVPFEDFAKDVRQTRGRLEDVLRDGERIEQGAPCPACSEDDEDARPLVQVRNDSDVSGASDQWICSRNRDHWWTEAGYRLRIADDYRANSDRLTATDMEAEYDIKRGSLSAWASEKVGKVRKRGKDHNGRQLYDVADALKAKAEAKAKGESAA